MGARSLLSRLDTTCTTPGSAELAQWLLEPAAASDVVRRQDAVRELRDDVAFREALALSTGRSGAEIDGGAAPALLIVSGSNMSGKSTLLRAIGLNAALAFAGAPVRARRLRLSRVAVFASIRSRDSVVDGVSRFQAEVRRLAAMLDAARAGRPVLFLVDELLHGTNSADRVEGASAVLTALVEAGAIGACTTHDLAVARVADALGARAANVHFADTANGSGVRFDYRLRPGVVARSNALALLRAAGVRV